MELLEKFLMHMSSVGGQGVAAVEMCCLDDCSVHFDLGALWYSSSFPDWLLQSPKGAACLYHAVADFCFDVIRARECCWGRWSSPRLMARGTSIVKKPGPSSHRETVWRYSRTCPGSQSLTWYSTVHLCSWCRRLLIDLWRRCRDLDFA